MIPIAVFLLALLAFLQAEGPVSQTLAIILSGIAGVLALLSLFGYGPTAFPVRRQGGPPVA